MSGQSAFAAALLAAEPVCPPGLAAWNGSDPGRRFAVYRNNVIVSLIDALADTYPVVQQLVGEEFFRAMARDFARGHPPDSPVLALYGKGFAEFIERFPPAQSVPYLADMARLELMRVSAYHAADAEPLSADGIAALLADAAALPAARFILHPSLDILRSRHAVVSLWAAHQEVMALEEVIPDLPEAALVVRSGLDVEICGISAGAAVFISQLRRGMPFGLAAEEAAAVDPAHDLAGSLGILIRSGAIVAVHSERSIAT